ncbi:Uncharacterised protein [Legionella steigerwaltii]|uniref:Transmembrane protein n=1 Tax=Legionella steigerwaltii TaxID=460 RepID=A0A378LFA1_9GAMM|nr:DUF1761 domain-containing protein [Legionella steigerwaltii]KTD79131.1 hypothetical protein Lstg_0890 [Legionella steigerwaltii]STY22761.1 Uncharacterised protein [Legionella steigerwaltii]
MPDLSSKFTDQKLKLLYGQVLIHYENASKRGLDRDQMYAEMYSALVNAMESGQSKSPFHLLDFNEKGKAVYAFNTLFRTLPIHQRMRHQQQSVFNPPMPQFNPSIKFEIHEYNNYNCNDSALLNYLLIKSIVHDSHYHGDSCFGSSHSHGHGSKSNDDLGKLIMALLVIALALIAVVLATIALVYMLYEFADSVDRFFYGEGWLKGALMLATSIGFGAGSAYLTLNFGAVPLIALAVAAGFNPVGVVIMGTVLLSIIGAGVGCFAMSLLYDSSNKSANKESMEPNDPDRFRLTTSEEEALRRKNIDPVAVKLAMIAKQAEMTELLGKEKSIPSFFNRDDKIQKLLTELRQIRKGEMNAVDIGGLHFDFTPPPPTVIYVPVYYQQPQVPLYQAPMYQPYQPQMYQASTHEPPMYPGFQDASNQIDGITPTAPPSYVLQQ